MVKAVIVALFVTFVVGLAAQEPATAPGRIDFVNDIHPLFTRMGCNAAACHGSALGQNGFRLSLFGGDPEADYASITQEFNGRRIDRARPELSLLLRKPTLAIPHDGGERFKKDSTAAATFLQWMKEGFVFGDRQKDVEIRATLDAGRIQVSEGPRDVTSLSTFSSNDEAIATVDADGRVTLVSPGETAIVIRFGGRVATVPVSKPFGPKPAAAPVANFIDELINEKLSKLGLPASPRCSDPELRRRLTLDLLGRLPAPDESLSIHDLVTSKEFPRFWAYRLDQFLKGDSKTAFRPWLEERLGKNAGWDEMVTAMVTGTQRGFLGNLGDPKRAGERVGEAFLATRWSCAQCHDHPFERFRQEDYYGIAAFFAPKNAEVTFPRTGKDKLPAFPGGIHPADLKDRRKSLAEWVIGKPMAKALVNRVWALLMGRGLIHPTDDLRSTNPPTHPELLDVLADFFVRHKYSVRDLVEVIVSSEAYARSCPGNPKDDRFYSHAIVKPLSPEVFADIVNQVGGDFAKRAIDDPLFTAPTGLARALQLINGSELKLMDDSIEGLYLRTLSRKPTAPELEKWRVIKAPKQEVLEDLLWAIVNSKEFGTNH